MGFESGRNRGPKRAEPGKGQRDVDAMGNVYGLPVDKIAKLKALAAQTATKSWWQASRHLIYPGYNTYLGLESGASHLYFYQPLVVPGILQTADYARAIEQPYRPTDTADDVENRVALRMQRAAVLTRQYNPARADFVLHENVLHTIVGSPTVMAGMCWHLADMSTRDNVSIRILPFTAGHPGHTVPTPYIVIDFPPESREPSVIYTETTTGTLTFEEDEDVKEFRQVHETLQRSTLEEQESRDRLRQLARRYKQ
ncbi:DUF5753 domain-containing protein [Nocardia nova]|uniref:DUF5753 domain-containing protein n=1 Tax=Nocardia nova TaxID=37330 RepID=UPI0033F4A8AF